MGKKSDGAKQRRLCAIYQANTGHGAGSDGTAHSVAAVFAADADRRRRNARQSVFCTAASRKDLSQNRTGTHFQADKIPHDGQPLRQGRQAPSRCGTAQRLRQIFAQDQSGRAAPAAQRHQRHPCFCGAASHAGARYGVHVTAGAQTAHRLAGHHRLGAGARKKQHFVGRKIRLRFGIYRQRHHLQG